MYVIRIMKMTPKMQVELFHLMFLRQLSTQLAADLYAIKGGCNIRFFFNSIRYSEDLDIDIKTIQKETLEKKINKVLQSLALKKLLQGYDIREVTLSAPKQTQTTQRWKMQLHTKQSTMPLHTKIEFSRRNEKLQTTFDHLSMNISQQYHLPPMRLSHYAIHDALTQKMEALAHRSETQARDVFDIYHLLSFSSIKPIRCAKSIIEKAKESIRTIQFDDYQSQVVSFLEPDHQKNFGNKQAWQDIFNTVKNYLDKIK